MINETIICHCLEEHEITGNAFCIKCNMELILLAALQKTKSEIENKLKQLAIDLTIITAEIHIRTIKPIKKNPLDTITIKKAKPIYTKNEKAKLEAAELIGLVMADKKEK